MSESKVKYQASEYLLVDISNLRANPHNPRGPVAESDPGIAEMAESIKSQGLLQPILVTPDGEPGVYTVVAGHRRLIAARLAGLTEVPATVRQMSQREVQEASIVENLQRQDLSPVEEARAFAQLVELGYTQADIARRVGCNHARVSRQLAILRLDPQVQDLIHRGEVPVVAVHILAKVQDPQAQRRLAHLSAKRRLTVPDLEELVRRHLGELNSERPSSVPKPTPLALPSSAPTARPGRQEALEALQGRPHRTSLWSEILDALEDACSDCGMSGTPTVCQECGLVACVARLVGR